MRSKTEVRGLQATKTGLVVYFVDKARLAPPLQRVTVPWGLLADMHQEIVEGNERVFLERIKADADQQYLPLEKWE